MNSEQRQQNRQDYDYRGDWQSEQGAERQYRRELYNEWPLACERAHNERSELWEDYEESWAGMTEFRLPPARANRVQGELDFGGEVA